MLEQYIALIVSIPAVAAVIACVTVACTILKKFASLKKSIDEITSVDDLKGKLNTVINENKELRQQVKKLTESITHVKEE